MVELSWAGDRVPVSRTYDDPYYALTDGLAESRHVFLAGTGLPARFAPGFQIAELGFGTGLNALVAWSAWRENRADGLRYTGFEAHPLDRAPMAEALSRWEPLAPMAADLLAAWPETAPAADITLSLPGLHLTVLIGDAAARLPAWAGRADAWFLDGFSPAKNPALWTPALLAEVARHTAPGGRFASYTAAGHVRRGLTEAGFAVERTEGFGKKRHMIQGTLA